MPCYQDDFETPGISPRSASWRKHKRQMPNLRKNARGRPQNLQRLCLRVENFGFLGLSWCNPTPSFTRFAVVAKLFAPDFRTGVPPACHFLRPNFYARNGIPMCFNSDRA